MIKAKSLATVLAVAISVICGLHTAAKASSILVDKGSYTYDPGNNLDWLDVTATLGKSYNDVAGNNGVQFIAQGWRFATLSEAAQLLNDGGLSVPSAPTQFFLQFAAGDAGYSAFRSSLLNLGNLLGWTYSQSFNGGWMYQTNGLLDPASTTTASLMTIAVADDRMPIAFEMLVGTNAGSRDFANSDGGVYLVRDHNIAVTPLPGSLLQFATAFVLLGLLATALKQNGHLKVK